MPFWRLTPGILLGAWLGGVVAGALSFAYVGWRLKGLPAGSSGYVYWPAAMIIVMTRSLFAPLGAALAHRLPGGRLKQVFGLFLFLVGGSLLLG